MAEFTLEQVFGAGATQNDTTVTIPKSALTAYGLVPSSFNSAEALLFGMVLKAGETLTELARSDDRTGRNVTVTRSPFDVLEDPPGSGLYFRRDIVTLLGYSAQPANPVDLSAYDQG